MSKKFDYLVFIGRVGPFHNEHRNMIMRALDMANNVIVLIGSSFRPITTRNPWSFDQRKHMVELSFSDEDNTRIHIRPLRDFMYNDQAWIEQVQNSVLEVRQNNIHNYQDNSVPKIGIIGHQKDETSFYLRLFPQWEFVSHPMNEEIHATDIRTLLFEQKNFLYLKGLLPELVFEYVKDYTSTPAFKYVIAEYNFIKNYKQAWAGAPYAPTFLTADAVVVQSGHVLMVVRDASPGEGLVALPGGFVDQKEYIECAALRELKEETKIDVPAKVLRGSIKHSKVYDHPLRSLRGRTVTQAFLIELPPGPLPKVKGSDDARHAMWIPFNEIDSEKCFEDHYDIIHDMLGKL